MGTLSICIGIAAACGSEQSLFSGGTGGGSGSTLDGSSDPDTSDDVSAGSDTANDLDARGQEHDGESSGSESGRDGDIGPGPDEGGESDAADGARSDTGSDVHADGNAQSDSTLDGIVGSGDAGRDARVDASDGAGGTDVARDAGGNHFDYLVIILMENKQLTEIYGPATFMTQLADQNVLLQHYTAVDHPSEPNYLAIAAGQTFNPPSDDDAYHVFNATNVVDRLEAVGKTWHAYSESAIGPCDTANPDVRHIPFLFFTDVVNDARRCARVLPTTPDMDDELIAELNSTTPSNLIWLTPNDSNNMHDTTVAVGDAYLAALVPRILSSTTFTTKRAALFITFDEGEDLFPDDFIYSVWAGPAVKKGQKFTTPYTHYSALATLAENWGFPPITANDAIAAPMTEVFP